MLYWQHRIFSRFHTGRRSLAKDGADSDRLHNTWDGNFSLARQRRMHLCIACLFILHAHRQWTTMLNYCKVCVMHKSIKSKIIPIMHFVVI
jgi:hypothetical protein